MLAPRACKRKQSFTVLFPLKLMREIGSWLISVFLLDKLIIAEWCLINSRFLFEAKVRSGFTNTIISWWVVINLDGSEAFAIFENAFANMLICDSIYLFKNTESMLLVVVCEFAHLDWTGIAIDCLPSNYTIVLSAILCHNPEIPPWRCLFDFDTKSVALLTHILKISKNPRPNIFHAHKFIYPVQRCYRELISVEDPAVPI